MTTPNNTVAGLAEKWRAEADDMDRRGEGTGGAAYMHAEANKIRARADELEAALASPAPSAPSRDFTMERGPDGKETGYALFTPSAGVVDDAVRLLHESGYHDAADALSGVSAPVGVEAGPLAGKYGDLLRPFVAMMNRELHANAAKGERGWLQMDRKTVLLEIFYHVSKLMTAARDDDQDGIREYGADVANMAMMLVDVCDALPKAALTPPAAAPRVEEPVVDLMDYENQERAAASEDGLPQVEGLTPKQAWWAGARAALGLAADTPRTEVARRLATAEQPGSAVQGGRELIRRLYVELLWCDRQLVDRGCKQGGSVRDVLADALEYLKSTPPPAPAAEQGEPSCGDGDALMRVYDGLMAEWESLGRSRTEGSHAADVYEWAQTIHYAARRLRANQPEARGVEETCQCNPAQAYGCPSCGRCYACHRRRFLPPLTLPAAAPASPGAVDEAMVRRALDAQPFAASRNSGARVWQLMLDERDSAEIMRAALTAALAGKAQEESNG